MHTEQSNFFLIAICNSKRLRYIVGLLWLVKSPTHEETISNQEETISQMHDLAEHLLKKQKSLKQSQQIQLGLIGGQQLWIPSHLA